MSLDLKGKRVMLIAPRFFGYEKDIQMKLANLGAIVDYVDIRPANGFLIKALIRIDRRFVKSTIEAYYDKVLKEHTSVEYDYVLILNLEGIFPAILQKFRSQFRRARFVLYMWDSFKNKRQTIDTIPFFDKVYSFERSDAEADPRILFRPLFFADQFDKDNYPMVKKEYDLSFIGTIHSDRYKIVSELREQAQKEGFNVYVYLYIQHKVLFFYRKLFYRNFRMAKMKDFHFKSISTKDVAQIFLKSKAVLDINHPKQEGLTMRTFEVLSTGARLITTNRDILTYDFYDPTLIALFDRNSLVLNKEFLTGESTELNIEFHNKYSLEGWLSELLA